MKQQLEQDIIDAQDEFDTLYTQGCRAATIMGVLQSKINIAKATLQLHKAQYDWS